MGYYRPMATRKRSRGKRTRRSRGAGGSFNPEKAIDKGLDLHREGRLIEAARLYRKVLEHEPDHADALNLLGLMALADGFVADAIDLHQRAVDSAPDSAALRANLGTALMARERGEAAEEALKKAMELGFEGVQAPFNLGLLYMDQGRQDDALAVLRRVAEIDPDLPEAGFLLAALSGEHREHAPPEYIVGLFDSYAGHFDEHLLEELEYRIPALSRALVDRELGEQVARASAQTGGWRVVDIGCGTGLVGAGFRDMARYLAGCDLSPRMVAMAGERGVYDDLAVEDLHGYLARQGEGGAGEGVELADLIVAADVFIYVGALEETARSMAAALRPGGYALFSIEMASADVGSAGFELRTSGRFAHSPEYIREMAGGHGFEIAAVEETTIRREAQEAIPGQLVLWRKAG